MEIFINEMESFRGWKETKEQILPL
jgi:hypothetical protein